MGFIMEFNWVLKLSQENGLEQDRLTVGRKYPYRKSGFRIYPVNMPIDLVNGRWEAVAKVKVCSFSFDGLNTTGEFEIIRIYDGTEKDALTKSWHETVELIIGKKIVDFNDVKVT